MKLKKILVLAGATVLLSGLPVQAGKISVESGKKLFNSPGLGGSTNGKSCNSCHPGGAKLEKAGANKELSKAINGCITGALGGKRIDGRSAEMKSLKMYIESLSQK
jgi:cytochrome c peroxidase